MTHVLFRIHEKLSITRKHVSPHHVTYLRKEKNYISNRIFASYVNYYRLQVHKKTTDRIKKKPFPRAY